MAIVCPSVTATDPHTYREQIDRISRLAKRIHIDIADNILAPKLIDIKQVWLPEHIVCDIHVMYQNPTEVVVSLIDLKPNLIILHAEADGDFAAVAKLISSHGIKVGVALLAKTPVSTITSSLDIIDHVLIFSGDLGHFGGHVDLSLLAKARTLKEQKPEIEIGWDGGINESNIRALFNGSVDVFNVGGYIQRSDSPLDSYAKLNLILLESGG